MMQFILSNYSYTSDSVRLNENPGIEESLSRVPPVCPNPLPEIIGLTIPKQAKRGFKIKDVFSPTINQIVYF